jgi:hypothetical protein
MFHLLPQWLRRMTIALSNYSKQLHLFHYRAQHLPLLITLFQQQQHTPHAILDRYRRA